MSWKGRNEHRGEASDPSVALLPQDDTVKWARRALLALLTPLLEKNVLKTLTVDAPLVFSMSRVIVLAFAVALLREIWRAGVGGWPEATLAMTIILAVPLLGALQRATPADVIELAKAIVGRFGEGAVRKLGTVYDREPSKFDDHRSDAS